MEEEMAEKSWYQRKRISAEKRGGGDGGRDGRKILVPK